MSLMSRTSSEEAVLLQRAYPRQFQDARAFTVIELTGVLAIMALLAAAVIPNVIRRLDRAAWERETSDLSALTDGLLKSVLIEKRIPATNQIPAAIATYRNLSLNQVTTTPRGFQRAFLVDPNANINGNDLRSSPFVQTNGVWANPPANARVMILASIARPALSTISDSFNDIWNTPEGGKPASWTGQAEDLRIQRLELGKSFYKLYLLNLDTNAGYYTFETNAPISSVTSAGGQLTAYVLDGTSVKLYRGTTNGTTLQLRVIMDSDQSFVYLNNRWTRDLSSNDRGTLADGSFGDWVDQFLNCGGPGPPYPDNWASPQAIVDQLYTYLWAYSVWADSNFQGIGGTTSQNPLYRVAYAAEVSLDEFSNNLIH
jgi:type II secretory pathway pseudopilin PulG